MFAAMQGFPPLRRPLQAVRNRPRRSVSPNPRSPAFPHLVCILICAFSVVPLPKLSLQACGSQALYFPTGAKISCRNMILGAGALTFPWLCHRAADFTRAGNTIYAELKAVIHRGGLLSSVPLGGAVEKSRWLLRTSQTRRFVPRERLLQAAAEARALEIADGVVGTHSHLCAA